MAEKGKQYRWETGRAIVENMLPTLPTPSYAAVILYCWFHAKGKQSVFNESAAQIARAISLKPRQVQFILSDLERAGCIKTLRPGWGKTPATRAIQRMRYTKPEPISQ